MRLGSGMGSVRHKGQYQHSHVHEVAMATKLYHIAIAFAGLIHSVARWSRPIHTNDLIGEVLYILTIAKMAEACNMA